MNLGYSHQVTVRRIPGITIEAPSLNEIIISGPDKQLVGQFAAEVRENARRSRIRAKGIKYADEHIRRKEGKAGGRARSKGRSENPW